MLLEGAEGGKNDRWRGEVPKAVGEHCNVKDLAPTAGKRRGRRLGEESGQIVKGGLLDPSYLLT